MPVLPGAKARLGKRERSIVDLHDQGQLFLHMFEMPLGPAIKHKKRRDSLENFFAVMAGDEKRSYSNEHHMNMFGSKEDGCNLLATTLLQAGKPIHPFLDQSQVGLLLDGSDAAQVKPFFVNNEDAYSLISGSSVTVIIPAYRQLGEDLRKCQIPGTFSSHGDRYRFDFKDKVRYRASAQEALRIFRNALKTQNWLSLYDPSSGGINEVLVSAHIKAVKAIVVSEKPLRRHKPGLSDSELYAIAVGEAVEMRDWLCTHYPKEFPKPLPIVSYHPARKHDQLRFLAPEALEKPELPPVSQRL